MASDTEEDDMVNCCWQCSDFVNVFPEFMAAIHNLKKKRKGTDEDNILEEIISKGNGEITNSMNDIFIYAVDMSYIIRNTYNSHFTYKICDEISGGTVCKNCGERIIPFDTTAYKVSNEVKYVDIDTFEILVRELYNLKSMIIGEEKYIDIENSKRNSMERSAETHEFRNKCNKLEEEIILLSEEITKKR